MLSYLFANQPLLEAQLDHFLAQDPTAIDEALLHSISSTTLEIMATLRGEDHATKSEFAFATLRKLVTSF
jgi:putative heme iron utilization protein